LVDNRDRLAGDLPFTVKTYQSIRRLDLQRTQATARRAGTSIHGLDESAPGPAQSVKTGEDEHVSVLTLTRFVFILSSDNMGSAIPLYSPSVATISI
jgi:hypothetical protein